MILWVLREADAQSVPSFKALRRFQDHLRTHAGIHTTKYESHQGNVFYANDIRDIIAKVSPHDTNIRRFIRNTDLVPGLQ